MRNYCHSDQTELFENQTYVLKSMNQKLTKNEINYLITVEDDFLSLLPGLILGIPDAHFSIHQPICLSYQHVPFLLNFMKKRNLFTVSGFMQKKIKKRTRARFGYLVSPIRSKKIPAKKKGWHNTHLGYYSAGRHKGDAIVNQLVLAFPEWDFTVTGQYYTHGFDRIPKNLHLWGDNPNSKRFYDSIGLLLVPSLIEEGFPRVILEAAVNGIPTIANSLGGIPEALGDSGIPVALSNNELDRLELTNL